MMNPPKKYKCLIYSNYDFNRYSIVPVREKDIQDIKKWRNEQIEFLRQVRQISNEEQKTYFETVIAPTLSETNPEIILFSFLENSILIGYGGFVNIDWKNKISEISFLIETKRSKNSLLYGNDFSIFLNFLKNIACNELKFNRLFTETYDIRPIHIQILEKNKFKISKRENGTKIIDGKSRDILFHSYICNKDENI